MKEILTCCIVAAAAMVACDNAPVNPGDFGVRSTLEVTGVRSLVTGTEYPLRVAREVDTALRADGSPARYVEFEPIVFPSYADVAMDTIEISFLSNANWTSDADTYSPEGNRVTWYSILNASTAGGGDASLYIGVSQFGNEVSRHTKVRNLLTRDSTIMYNFTFRHTGLRYEPGE